MAWSASFFSMANTWPCGHRRAASRPTEPLPAPMSQTTLSACSCSRARLTARTSCLVIRPFSGWRCSKALSARPKRTGCGRGRVRHSSTTFSSAKRMLAASVGLSCACTCSSGCSRSSATAMWKSLPRPSASSRRAMRSGQLAGLVSSSRRCSARRAWASAYRPCEGGAPRCHSPASAACTETMRASCQARPTRAQASCRVERLGRISSASRHRCWAR